MPNERPKLWRNPLANVGGDSPLMKVHDKKHLQLSSPDWEAMFRLAPPSIRAFAALWVRFQPTIQQECTLWRLEDTSSLNSRHLMGIFVRTHHCADSNARSPVMIDTTTLVDAGEVTLYCSLWLQTMWSHSLNEQWIQWIAMATGNKQWQLLFNHARRIFRVHAASQPLPSLYQHAQHIAKQSSHKGPRDSCERMSLVKRDMLCTSHLLIKHMRGIMLTELVHRALKRKDI